MSRKADHPAAPLGRLEARTRFSESGIWGLQREYYAARGPEAWRGGEVPHYITCNPAMAAAHAEIVFAFFRDRAGLEEAGPLTICELGAGAGRFAFHFLRALERLCAESDVAPSSFRYVLTDAAEANIESWLRHPRFAPFFADGRLDAAHLDLARPGPLRLRIGGERIGQGALTRPMVTIANYVLDSLPQDLHHFAGGNAAQCLVTCDMTEPVAADPAALLAGLVFELDEVPLDTPPYPEADFCRLVEQYAGAFEDSYLMFPVAGLRALRHLSGISRNGLLFLASDGGEHRLAAMDGFDPPPVMHHGSISFWVNFHAFAELCRAGGGVPLLPERPPRNLETIALMMMPDAEGHAATRAAYRRHVAGFGPDDYFELMRHGWATAESMSAEAIFAFLRLSHDDGELFLICLPRLLALAATLDEAQIAELKSALERIWAGHFPIGENRDLAAGIAALLYAADDHEGAIPFFMRSMAIHGRDTGTLFNIGCCHHLLGRDAEAAEVLREVLTHDPANEAARELLATCTGRAAAACPSVGKAGIAQPAPAG